jgi:hypothetical protein
MFTDAIKGIKESREAKYPIAQHVEESHFDLRAAFWFLHNGKDFILWCTAHTCFVISNFGILDITLYRNSSFGLLPLRRVQHT